MNKKFMAFTVAVFFALINVTHAANYLLGYSAVDGDDIRWSGSTSNSTGWYASIYTWNQLNKIKISPDTIYTVNDLTVSDVNRSDGVWSSVLGVYSYNYFGVDKIQFNVYTLQRANSLNKQNCASHELGHALGLNHSFGGNLMYKYGTQQTSLGNQDISDYRYLWGY